MNILFVYFTAIIPTRGGTERVTHNIGTALKEKGHKVYYLSTNATSQDITKLQSSDYFFINPKLNKIKQIEFVKNICNKLKIDVIINESGTWDDFSIFSKNILSNIKIITCLHYDISGIIKFAPRGYSTNPIKRFIINIFSIFGVNLYFFKHILNTRARYRKMLLVSDAVVVVTPIIAKQLIRLTQCQSKKIISIFNPLSIKNVLPKYNATLKEKMFLFVGRLSKEKNVELLLKAWATIAHQHPLWKLEIAGDGELHDGLIKLTKELNIPRVFFHGHKESLTTLYNRAEYLILPSNHESFSCVVIESMVYGCHPIVFDYPSASIVIPNTTIGTRIKHKQKSLEKAMSNAINNNISNKYQMNIISNHLAQFNINKIIEEWETLLKRLQ